MSGQLSHTLAQRVQELEREHFLAMVGELQADPCTPERARLARHADHLAHLVFQARRAELLTFVCETCGRPARQSGNGLCDGCSGLYDLELAHWYALRPWPQAQAYAREHFRVARAVRA